MNKWGIHKGSTGPTLHKLQKGARGIAIVTAVVVVVSGGVIAISKEAEAATATGLKTAGTSAALALSLAKTQFPQGASKVVVASNTQESLQIAANLGSRLGVPVLSSAQGANSGEVLTPLKNLKATTVVTVSEPGFFSDAFKAELTSASMTVESEVAAPTVFGKSVAAYRLGTTPSEVVLSRTDDTAATALATSYAGARGLPLVMQGTDTPESELTSFFAELGTAKVTVVGDPTVSPTTSMSEDQMSTYLQVDTTDPTKAMIWAAATGQAQGANSSKVVVAARNRLDILGLAAGLARSSGTIALPAGDVGSLTTDSQANQYFTLWRTGIAGVTLAGLNLNNTDLTNVSAPTTSAVTTPSPFRTTDFKRTSATSYTLVLTAVSGATKYRALDLDGTVLATSTTPSLTFKAQIPSAVVVAESSTKELGRIQFHSNDYSSDASRATVVTSTIGSTKANLQFLGSARIPRLITQVKSDPFDASVAPTAPRPVAITCASTWSNSGLDPTKEYEYAVSALTNVDSSACDASLPNAPATAAPLSEARVTAPYTSLPSATASTSGVARSVSGSPAANPSRIDLLLKKSIEGAKLRKPQSGVKPLAAGDGWPDALFRWQAYIPDNAVPFPGFSGDFGRPQIGFHGDGHGTGDPNGSARFTQTLQIKFGSQPGISYTEKVGETLKYKCKIWLSDCVVTARATAPGSELNWSGTSPNGTSATAKLRAAATIPLVKGAPAIDTDVSLRFGVGTSRMTGYHDLMPKHEAYIGVPGSEWIRVYQSPYLGWFQLACLTSSPSVPSLTCGTYFNVQL